MATKPFTPNEQAKMEALVDAANHILSAIKALEAAKSSADNWAEHSSINHYKNQLLEFMASDNGESGFSKFVLWTSDDVFGDAENPVRNAHELAMRYK